MTAGSATCTKPKMTLAQEWKRFGNHVAGATLFPKVELLKTDTVRQHRKGDSSWSDKELADLSRQFGGGARHCGSLIIARVDKHEFLSVEAGCFSEALCRGNASNKKGFAPPHQVALSSAGPTFTGLVIESFNRERITASDVSDYLQIRLKHLAEVQRDYARFAL